MENKKKRNGKQKIFNGHEFKNGVFVAPFNTLDFMRPCNWFTERQPEYLWLGLILNSFDDRKVGLNQIMKALQRLSFASDKWPFPALSGLFEQGVAIQQNVYQILEEFGFCDAISPLSLVYSFSEQPVFSSFFAKDEFDFENNLNVLETVIRKMADHQSDFATDIRFCVLYYRIISGLLHMPADMIKDIALYPTIDHSDERMRSIRPFIRSSEGTFPLNNKPFLEDFWRKCGAMFECKSFTLPYEKNVSEEFVKKYTTLVKDVFYYYRDLYRITNPLDDKMLVLLGLSIYSYKRFLEIIEHNLYNAISGRSIVRVLIEDYIMMKFLLKKESDQPNIWKEYQSYGMGNLKLVTERYNANNKSPDENSHLDLQYLNILVDVFKNRFMQDMDTRFFGDSQIRQKFEDVNEKDLYFIYDYDSSFEHGLWGAIRESALLSCDTPGHQYHCIPDVDNLQKMKSVWHDSVMVLNKTIKLLVDQYDISDDLKTRVAEYGI